MENQVIRFYPWNGEETANKTVAPHSAKGEVADYWKNLPLGHGIGDAEKFKSKTADRANVHLGLKHCMPYFDAMTFGYHFRLHTDVYVLRKADGLPEITWDHDLHPVSVRHTFEMPTPHGHYDAHYSWQMHWGIKSPDSYGLMMMHPINRYDLPFTTVAGYMDADVYPMPGNVSFHIKNNFEGVIPKGTPIMSLIPIKRESWVSEIDSTPEFFKGMVDLAAEKQTVPMAHYKKGYRKGFEYK
jgi:hypothetical protein